MNENKKNKILLYVCIAIFGLVGVYLTFFYGNTSKYNSETRASRIDVNERYDSDGTMYYPKYYFNVNGVEYVCESSSGSSSYPSESKNKVYYDSTDPQKCMTEYETSGSKLFGIIFLVLTAIMIYFFVIKKPSNLNESYSRNDETNYPVDEEQVQKAMNIIGKVSLIYKRIVLGVIIIVLLIFILIDTALFRQTIKAKDYIETTATYVGVSPNTEDERLFDEHIYTFKDKKGIDYEIVVSNLQEGSPSDKITIKYNESNPKEFYEETALLNKSGIIWYIVKIVVLVLLIVLFFSKKILNKIGISLG